MLEVSQIVLLHVAGSVPRHHRPIGAQQPLHGRIRAQHFPKKYEKKKTYFHFKILVAAGSLGRQEPS